MNGAKTTTELCPPKPNEFEIPAVKLMKTRKLNSFIKEDHVAKSVKEEQFIYELAQTKHIPTLTSCCFLTLGTVSIVTSGSKFYKH